MRSDTPRVVSAGLLFLLSGAAALVYQVLWQRLLALHSGVGLYSVAMIVAAFMAGLGLGSLVGGWLSGRLSPRGCLLVFAALELVVACFGAASPWLFYDVLYPRAVHLPTLSWPAGLLHFAALLPPTTLMGMSLPFLVRAVVTDVAGAGRRIGWLYGANVVGAASGALATPWVLLPALGVYGAALVAAAANAVAGVGVLALVGVRTPRPLPDVTPPPSTDSDPEAPGGRPLGLWLALYALSGFIALSLEIVWFRILNVAVKSTTFTFGTLLAIYLLGTATGALATAPFAARLRRPLQTFLFAQCAVLIVSTLTIVGLVMLPRELPLLDWYFSYWAANEKFAFGHVADATRSFRLYLILPVLLFFTPTVIMGVSFTVLQRAVHDDPRTTGRRVGLLQAANIAGCTLGSLFVGLFSLAALGTAGTLRLLAGCGVVFAAVGLLYYGRRFVVPTAVLVLLVLLVPGQERLWRRLHGVASDVPLALFDEDGTGVVGLTPGQERWWLTVDGIGNSWLPYGSVHTLLGAVPASIHPDPRHVAVVGLGSGDTAWAASYRPETLSTTVYEISYPQPRILWRFAGVMNRPTLRGFLEDSRVHIRLEDGRKGLEAETATFDLIETDATWPESAGSGNLYSLEFYELVARHLNPGGIACTWSPTRRVTRTFRTVFPHVLESRKGVLIGSLSPLPLEPDTWVKRAERGEGYLGPDRTRELVDELLHLKRATGAIEGSLNRDLFPRDEFAVSSD